MLTVSWVKIENDKDWYPWSLEELRAELGVTQAPNTPLSLESFAKCGALFALKALLAVDGHRNAMRLYACRCAQYSLNFFEQAHPDDKRPRQAIETVERFARGSATDRELSAAWTAALDSPWGAAHAATAAYANRQARRIGFIIRMGAGIRDIERQQCIARVFHCMAAEAAGSVRKVWDAGWDPAKNALEDAARSLADAVTWDKGWRAVQPEKDDDAVVEAWCNAWGAAQNAFNREFLRLCRLEGEYGEVDVPVLHSKSKPGEEH